MEGLTNRALFTLGVGFFASEATSIFALKKPFTAGFATYTIGHATQFFAADLIDRFLPSEANEVARFIPFFISAVAASFAVKKLYNRTPEGTTKAPNKITTSAVLWIRALGETALTLVPLLAHAALKQGCSYTHNVCPEGLTDWNPLNFGLNGLLA